MTNSISCERYRYKTSPSVTWYKYIFYTSLCCAIFLIPPMFHKSCQLPYQRPAPPAAITNLLPCSDVLGTMTKGRWSRLPYAQQNKTALHHFLREVRTKSWHLPATLQRTDNLCGNVTFDNLTSHFHKLLWFRALCDPEGRTPCCYENRCEAKTVDQCRCRDCFDLRQPIDVEFAEWKPLNDSCKMVQFQTPDSVCRLLNNMTIYFIGESFMRHFYISLLYLLRESQPLGPLKRTTPINMVHKCLDNKQFAYTKWCMGHIDFVVSECDKKVNLKFMEYNSAAQRIQTVNAISELRGKNNSFIFFGIGIWDDFNAAKIIKDFLIPVQKAFTCMSVCLSVLPL